MSPPHRRIVVVGASLAGLRTAQALRAEGFTGALTLVGAEPHHPYDRPPLAKELLLTDAPPGAADLPVPDDLGADWLLGRPAIRLRPAAHTVELADGRLLPYDGLVLATGTAARRWSGADGGPPTPPGVLTLRDRDDLAALRPRLAPGRRVVVVGGGFLGGEVAAAARARGAETTLVVSGAQPLERAVGAAAGAWVSELHRAAGIHVLTDRRLAAVSGDTRQTVLRLSDGTTLTCDTAVLALGAVANTAWLAGSGLLAGPGGVDCDASLRVLRADGTPAADIVAAGDVARWPHPLADGRLIALGHWTNAVEQAVAAARALLRPAAAPHTAIPSFWSGLHGVTLRSVGLPALADEAQVHEADFAGRRLEVSYHRRGRPVGALTIGRVARLAAHRRELAASLESGAVTSGGLGAPPAVPAG